jgi:hypothetical protein
MLEEPSDGTSPSLEIPEESHQFGFMAGFGSELEYVNDHGRLPRQRGPHVELGTF